MKETQIIHPTPPIMMLVVAQLAEARHQRRHRPQQMLAADQVAMPPDKEVAAQVASVRVVRLSREIVMRLDGGAIASISDQGSGFIRYETNRLGIKMVNFILLYAVRLPKSPLTFINLH